MTEFAFMSAPFLILLITSQQLASYLFLSLFLSMFHFPFHLSFSFSHSSEGATSADISVRVICPG